MEEFIDGSQCARGRHRDGRAQLTMNEMTMTLDDIERESPPNYDIEGQLIDPNRQYAYYGTNCCWWTTYREDIGKSQHARAMCCPHCGCVVKGCGLVRFIKRAKADPDHYGPRGMEVLVLAHSRNVTSWCGKNWWRYIDHLTWLDTLKDIQ